MNDLTDDLARVGRADLIDMIRRLLERVQNERDRNQQLDFNLTSVQTRCTELLNELRELKGGIVLPGWRCPCGSFNGATKTWHERCRSCDAERPR